MLNELLFFLPFGYLATILVETPIIYFGLPERLSPIKKILCSLWLTACTYPFVVIIFPLLFLDMPRWQYLIIAETFAPLAECILFYVAFRVSGFSRSEWVWSMIAIVIANLASFGLGELLHYFEWFGLF